MEEPTTPVETPAGSQPADLAAYRAQRENPAPESKAAPVVDDAPDPDLVANPEIGEEIDKIEAPKPEETAQEKRARTLKHKANARKAWESRRQNELTRLKRENEDLRQRAAQPSPVGGNEPPARANQPAPRQAEIDDPRDPEPTLETVSAAKPDSTDIYADWLKEWNRWDRRQEQRQADLQRRGMARREQRQQADAHILTMAESGRATHTDFEQSISALGDLFQRADPQADRDLHEAIASITDVEVGREVLYRLGKSLDETRGALTSKPALLRHIGRLEAEIHAEKAKPAAAPLVTAAPAPHTPVSGASTVGSTFDPKKSVSVEDYRRNRDSLLARR